MALLDLFKLAVAEGLVDGNPVTGTRQPAAPKKQKPRKRTLDGAELGQLWNATGGDADYDKIVRLAILFGGRRQEIGGMGWSELDLEAATWTLPAARIKTKKDLVLPLPPAAVAILRSVERRDGRDLVFGSRSPDGFTAWSDAKRELDERLELKRWCLHDLRRTLITSLHDLNVEPHIVKAVVGHSQGADVHHKHYNWSIYMAQKTEALRLWADHVAQLAAAAGNSVELRQAA
jgi:integrase